MAIAKMKLLTIFGSIENLDNLILTCVDKGCFHPEYITSSREIAQHFTKLNRKNPYSDMLTRVVDVGASMGIHLQYDDSRNSELTADMAYTYIDWLHGEIDSLNSKKRTCVESIEQCENALSHLNHMENLNVNLDDIFNSVYLKVRFGRLPVDSFSKLQNYDDKLFIFIPFEKDNFYYWGMYFTVDGYSLEVDTIMTSLYFERYWVPDFVKGTPELALKKFEDELKKSQQDLAEVELKISDLLKENTNRFNCIYAKVKFMRDTFEMQKYVVTYNNFFIVDGFVPEDDCDDFIKCFDGIESLSFEVGTPEADKSITPPTKLKNNRFIRPFEMFVEMFGLPSYYDIDPTPFLAWSYIILFGIMFGDVGQGLIVALIGFILAKWKGMKLGSVMVRLGISSSVFGLVFGSVFGFEEALNPLYMKLLNIDGKPLDVMNPDTTIKILLFAVGLGIVIILVSIITNIYIGFRQKRIERAVFSENGIVGLMFYGGALWAVVSTMLLGKNPLNIIYVLVFFVIPLILLFLKEPIIELLHNKKIEKPKDGIATFFIQSFFELFEVLLSYVTNTMSFLRVGGFILSHAGMMIVVFALAEMVGGFMYPIVLIIGNLFVIAMEGLIVGIQVLRLEFYEMFSRYYVGTGHSFNPINYNTIKNNI